MLEELHIRNIGVIEDVTLEFTSGLNVLTGETGAGKTMVVSALELLRGARADSDQLRTRERAAVVEARLRPAPPGASEWTDDDELVASREVLVEGSSAPALRSRARVGGRLAPVSALADVVGAAIDVHGQGDSTQLTSGGRQRDLLDRWGGPQVGEARRAYEDVWRRWRAAEDERARLRDDERDRARELDRLAFELAEIDAVAPAPDEDASLEAELRRLEHAEGLVQAASAALAAVTGERGARDGLGAGVAHLRAVAGVDDDLETLRERLEGLAAEAQDVALELGGYAESLQPDPPRLEALRERRASLTRLRRKYGPDVAAVLAYAEEARRRQEELRSGDERASALDAQVEVLHEQATAAAGALSAARREAAVRLAEVVQGHLEDLAMGGARFSVVVEVGALGPHGADRVEFLLAANPGAPPLPVSKAASGGERSRVALALRLALADSDDTPVLIFDEVDAGVGGAAALALGRKLAQLAEGRQVLCVTHLAQLAAFADTHLVVAKDTDGEQTVTTVRRLDEDERACELSRMLSGTQTPQALEHAVALRRLAVDAVQASA